MSDSKQVKSLDDYYHFERLLLTAMHRLLVYFILGSVVNLGTFLAFSYHICCIRYRLQMQTMSNLALLKGQWCNVAALNIARRNSILSELGPVPKQVHLSRN